MVRNNAEGYILFIVLTIPLFAEIFCPGDKAFEQIGIVIGGHPLNHCCQTLQSHARVDVRFREWGELAIGTSIKLCEYQVPDFQVTITVAPRRAIRSAAAQRLALVNQDLRAWTAWTGIAHGPEIVFLTQTDDSLRGNTYLVLPYFVSLVIVPVHGDIQEVSGQLIAFRQKFPCPFYGLFLEVIPEGKIPKHFKEGMVPGRVAHIFKIIVFSPCTYALLGISRSGVASFLLSKKEPLERRHPRINKKQGGIIQRDQ